MPAERDRKDLHPLISTLDSGGEPEEKLPRPLRRRRQGNSVFQELCKSLKLARAKVSRD